jgi:hypothetical protein
VRNLQPQDLLQPPATVQKPSACAPHDPPLSLVSIASSAQPRYV